MLLMAAAMESGGGGGAAAAAAAGGDEEDVRSIEAENIGDDDELDADLEREFLQQQEAKVRLRSAWERGGPAGVVGGGQLDDDRFRARRAQRRQELQSEEHSPSEEGTLHMGLLRNSSEVVERSTHGQSRLGKGMSAAQGRALDSELTLFPELDRVQCVNGSVTMGEKSVDKEIDSFGPGESSRHLENGDEISAWAFQVPFPKKKEETKWLGLGLPSHSNKYTKSGEKQPSKAFFHNSKNTVSGSSSKVSIATSLERQYSTGSTSTVESPHFVVQERNSSDRPRPTREVRSSSVPRLTFSFPGWRVDISKGEKQHPSIVSHHSDTAAAESDGMLAKRSRKCPDCSGSLGEGVEENLGDKSPVRGIPDEILLQVMRRLELSDLCSAVQACTRWYNVGLRDDLWGQHLGDCDRGMLSDSSSDVLPRWVCKKNLCLSESVRRRFSVFSKGYDYLRRALHEWWNNGLLNSRHSSKGVYSLIRKLTVNDWTLLYEAFAVAFTDRSDRIANTLLRKLKQCGHSNGGGTSSERNTDGHGDWDDGLLALYENSKSRYALSGTGSELEVHWKSGAVREVTAAEGVIGIELWELLLKSWKRFKGWLHLISTHCPDLNHEVMVERTRSLNRPATPTVYDKGLIYFRSQIVLRYELRKVLQGGFMVLMSQDARGCSSEHEMDLLRASHHLLQELDVPDDFTLPVTSHTQTKLRQCFRGALLKNSKTALHMNDKLNYL